MASSKYGNQTKIASYYPPELIDQLKQLSDSTRTPQAAYLREALEDLLSKKKKLSSPAPFGYQSEKFHLARSNLMLPTPNEAAAIAAAFHNCSKALTHFDRKQIKDENVLGWLTEIDGAMNVTGLDDPHGKGLWEVKAGKMTELEKYRFSTAIDECASWFSREFWSAFV